MKVFYCVPNLLTIVVLAVSLMEMGKFVPQLLREFTIKWASPEYNWSVHAHWFAAQKGLLIRFEDRKAGARVV